MLRFITKAGPTRVTVGVALAGLAAILFGVIADESAPVTRSVDDLAINEVELTIADGEWCVTAKRGPHTPRCAPQATGAVGHWAWLSPTEESPPLTAMVFAGSATVEDASYPENSPGSVLVKFAQPLARDDYLCGRYRTAEDAPREVSISADGDSTRPSDCDALFALERVRILAIGDVDLTTTERAIEEMDLVVGDVVRLDRDGGPIVDARGDFCHMVRAMLDEPLQEGEAALVVGEGVVRTDVTQWYPGYACPWAKVAAASAKFDPDTARIVQHELGHLMGEAHT